MMCQIARREKSTPSRYDQNELQLGLYQMKKGQEAQLLLGDRAMRKHAKDS